MLSHIFSKLNGNVCKLISENDYNLMFNILVLNTVTFTLFNHIIKYGRKYNVVIFSASIHKLNLTNN